jgi:His-Xaa-Ser system protein HxsD
VTAQTMPASLPWSRATARGESITVDLALYSPEAVLRAAHAFTGRCYVFTHLDDDGNAVVELAPRHPDDSLRGLIGEFSNALLDQRLRALIAGETRVVRELLVAQAFCEGDLLDREDAESDEADDPRGIAG